MNDAENTFDWSAIRARLARTSGSTAETQQVQAILAARARTLARKPVAAPAVVFLKLLVFWLEDEQFGIETQYLREVLRLETLTPLPGGPSHLAGVTNLHGEVLPVADWRGMGRARPATMPLDGFVLVLGRAEPELGWLVERVEEVRSVPKDQLHEAPSAVPEPRRKFLCGVTAQALSVLDGALLLSDESFFF